MASELESGDGHDSQGPIPPHAEQDSHDWSAEADVYGADDGGSASLEPRDVAQALGWVSIGLGVVQLVAPRGFGRAIGVGDQAALLRLCGLREVTNGIGLLSGRRSSAWAMARVASDALDLALLGAAARRDDTHRSRLTLAIAATTVRTALDIFAAQHLRGIGPEYEPIEVVLTPITVDEEPAALYAFWHKLDNLSRLLPQLASVYETGERTSRWSVRVPGGATITWDAEIVVDEASSRIAWRTLPRSQIRHEGIVSFEPAPGGGTTMRLAMSYVPPVGKLGVLLARFLKEDLDAQVGGALQRMKQLVANDAIAPPEPQGSASRYGALGRTQLGRYIEQHTRQWRKRVP